MTKCNRSEINLKSTAYNLSGQNYFEQLSAYNSMNAHLRRVLLARCVVDARNKNYTCKRKQLLRQSDRKSRLVTAEITSDMIDRLAYDTLHHPADFLKISSDSQSEYLCQRNDEKYFTDCCDYNVICSRSRLQNHVVCPSFPTFKANKSESFISNKRQIKQQISKSEFKIEQDPEHRYEEDSIVYESTSDLVRQEINHQLSMAVNSLRNYEFCDVCKKYKIARMPANTSANHTVCVNDEEPKYAKFVYEITKEIMHNDLYTDEQFQGVFTKHLERNKEFLDMNKMLHEIHELKIALNVLDDSDDDELKNMRTRQVLNTSRVRSPTPPKVLNENKVIEKLGSYQKAHAVGPDRDKFVTLIDANTELLLTERDVLSSLMEANIAPDQAQKIYRKLFSRSKDIIPTHPVTATTKQPNDAFAEIADTSSSKTLNNLHEINELEKSGTSDYIPHEDKNVQA